MSNVKEIGPQGYTIPLIAREISAAAEAEEIKHGMFVAIDPNGGVRIWQTGMTLAQAAYICKMVDIATQRQLTGD